MYTNSHNASYKNVIKAWTMAKERKDTLLVKQEHAWKVVTTIIHRDNKLTLNLADFDARTMLKEATQDNKQARAKLAEASKQADILMARAKLAKLEATTPEQVKRADDLMKQAKEARAKIDPSTKLDAIKAREEAKAVRELVSNEIRVVFEINPTDMARCWDSLFIWQPQFKTWVRLDDIPHYEAIRTHDLTNERKGIQMSANHRHDNLVAKHKLEVSAEQPVQLAKTVKKGNKTYRLDQCPPNSHSYFFGGRWHDVGRKEIKKGVRTSR